jgi:hypothetical protein
MEGRPSALPSAEPPRRCPSRVKCEERPLSISCPLYPRLRWHWLDYDPVALAVLAIGIGMIELLALII